MGNPLVPVFRILCSTAGQEISPGHMWGTLEAIATLENCVPIPSTERLVDRSTLDAHGFLFEHSYVVFAAEARAA